MRAITLEENVDCGHICRVVQDVINDYLKDHQNTRDTILVLEVKKPVINDSLTLRLPLKNSES